MIRGIPCDRANKRLLRVAPVSRFIASMESRGSLWQTETAFHFDASGTVAALYRRSVLMSVFRNTHFLMVNVNHSHF